MKRVLLPVSLGLLLAGCSGNPDAGTPRERATAGAGDGSREAAVNRRQDTKSEYQVNDPPADRENRAGQAVSGDSRNAPDTTRHPVAGEDRGKRR